MKEEHWNRCLIAASGGFFPENMLLGRKRLILLGNVVVAPTGLLVAGISDTISIGNNSAPDSEVASSVNQTDDSSSATATITITYEGCAFP